MVIVIVDDSPTNLVVLRHLAKGQGGHTVMTFTQPREAQQFLADNKADLVVADCEMPDIDGISFIANIRAFTLHRRTPIMMVTSHTESSVRHEALAAGATEFISKPVDAGEFKLRVRNLLALQQSRIQAPHS